MMMIKNIMKYHLNVCTIYRNIYDRKKGKHFYKQYLYKMCSTAIRRRLVMKNSRNGGYY